MKLSRSTMVTFNRDYYKLLADVGFEALDVNEAANPKILDGSGNISLSEIKRFALSLGMEIGQCHAPGNLYINGHTAEEREQIIASIEKCIGEASKADIKCTIVHPIIYSWAGGDDDIERTFNLNYEYLNRICKKANGTFVCLENMPGVNGTVIAPEQIKRFTDAIPNLFVCVDTGHMISNGLLISDFFKALGNKIIALHIHDTFPGSDRHLLPYTGVGNWDDFKKSVHEYAYSGNLNSESKFSAVMPKENLKKWESVELEVLKSFL